MIEYSIGKVSALLNLSRDMIRYYEKQGAIKSKRNEENNYRTYDTMEVFWLLEALQHKTWGIPISEITEIRGNHYSVRTEEFLGNEIARLKGECSYQTLLAERLTRLREYHRFGAVNIGNFWVAEMPAAYRYYLVRGRGGDDYDEIRVPKEVSRFIFSDRVFPFVSSALTAGDTFADWEMEIEEKYVNALGDTETAPVLPEGYTYVPASTALCTHIDIGEVGEFDPDVFNVIREYAKEHGYDTKEDCPVRGILLGRGFENGEFRRILRLYLPIR